MKTCRVPAEIVIPIVKRYLDIYETHGSKRGGGENFSLLGKQSAVTVLAGNAGMNIDTLRKLMKGRTKDISFYVVDRLFCAMDQPMSWYDEAVLPFYLSADLSVEPDPPQKKRTKDRCRNGHIRTPKNTTRTSRDSILCKDCDWEAKQRRRAAA